MKKKAKILKITTLILIILTIIFGLTSNSFAIEFNPDAWKPGSTTDAQGSQRIFEIGNDVIGIIQLVGTFVSVGVLVVLGIKYMMGSVEEKASYKKAMLPYLIGAIMLFAITNILAIVVNLVKDGGL